MAAAACLRARAMLGITPWMLGSRALHAVLARALRMPALPWPPIATFVTPDGTPSTAAFQQVARNATQATQQQAPARADLLQRLVAYALSGMKARVRAARADAQSVQLASSRLLAVTVSAKHAMSAIRQQTAVPQGQLRRGIVPSALRAMAARVLQA